MLSRRIRHAETLDVKLRRWRYGSDTAATRVVVVVVVVVPQPLMTSWRQM